MEQNKREYFEYPDILSKNLPKLALKRFLQAQYISFLKVETFKFTRIKYALEANQKPPFSVPENFT